MQVTNTLSLHAKVITPPSIFTSSYAGNKQSVNPRGWIVNAGAQKQNFMNFVPSGNVFLESIAKLPSGIFLEFVELIWTSVNEIQNKLELFWMEFNPTVLFRKLFLFKSIDDVKTPESFPPLRSLFNSMEDMMRKLVSNNSLNKSCLGKLHSFLFLINKFKTSIYEHKVHLFFGCVKDDNQKPLINLLRGRSSSSKFITREDFFDRAHPFIFGKALKIFSVIIDLKINFTVATNLQDSKIVDEMLSDVYMMSRYPTCPSTEYCFQTAHKSVNFLKNASPGNFNILISVLTDLENSIMFSNPLPETLSSSIPVEKIQARKPQVKSIKLITPTLHRNDSNRDSSFSSSSSPTTNNGSPTKASGTQFSDSIDVDDGTDTDDDQVLNKRSSHDRNERLITIVDNIFTSFLLLLFFIYLFYFNYYDSASRLQSGNKTPVTERDSLSANKKLVTSTSSSGLNKRLITVVDNLATSFVILLFYFILN